MNERIRELADEAKMSTYLLAYGVEFNISIEKFAQLIVRECAKVILETPVDYMETDTMHRIRDSVKQHFGVEE